MHAAKKYYFLLEQHGITSQKTAFFGHHGENLKSYMIIYSSEFYFSFALCSCDIHYNQVEKRNISKNRPWMQQEQ
jgi:hypothetical protein